MFSHFKQSQKLIGKFSFTLAEVLITLTIIGVVASMTLPVLTANHKRIEYAAKLKKFYNMMNSAISQAESDYDIEIPKTFTQTTPKIEIFNKYLKDYIKYTKIDTTDQGSNQFPMVYLDDGSRMRLANGVIYSAFPNLICNTYAYDVNGDSAPNVIGRDIFLFYWCNEGNGFGTEPRALQRSRTNLKNECRDETHVPRKGSDSWYGGGDCLALVIYDNWEFKQDYPRKL